MWVAGIDISKHRYAVKKTDTYISNNCSICNLSSILEDKSIQVIDIDTGSNSREKNNS